MHGESLTQACIAVAAVVSCVTIILMMLKCMTRKRPEWDSIQKENELIKKHFKRMNP